MRKYLKVFRTHEEYLEFTRTPEFLKPNVSHCIVEKHVHYNPKRFADDYFTFVAREDATFTFTPQNSNIISYSIDNGTTWTQGNSVEVNNGNKVMWKGEMTPSSFGIGQFRSTGNFDVQGNIMSLLYGDNFEGQTDLTGKDYAFGFLFPGTRVINAKNLSLPATTLARSCYYNMFNGCTKLITAPNLPATTLTYSCYDNMFYGCTNLVIVPELPATILATQCYWFMFSGCSSLTTAPELPATTLANNCYNHMFSYCTSLTTAPILPATTLVERCYEDMFYNCTNLNYIKAMFTTTPDDNYTKEWVSGVSATGTFVKNSAAQWDVSGVNGIPTGWTVQTASV